MATRHTISHAETLFWSPAVNGQANSGLRGQPLTPMVAVSLGAPTTASANNISLSQSVTGAGTAFLLNGTTAGTLDVPRNVVGAWTGTAIITITGKDQYGVTMTEVSASGTSHTGTKAFKIITSVTTSASITAATLGTGVKLGLPYAVAGKYDVITVYADTTVDTTATVVGAVTTTATSSTGDVRGTITTASAPDSSKVFRIKYVTAGATTTLCFGVAQA